MSMMDQDILKVLYTQEEIAARVKVLGEQMYEDFKEETGLDETLNEFQDASRDLSNTLRDADPRRELREAQHDAQKVIKEAEKEVKSDQ